jgi:uncharacterized membrane protein YphA (DoxX/SURF4 family)
MDLLTELVRGIATLIALFVDYTAAFLLLVLLVTLPIAWIYDQLRPPKRHARRDRQGYILGYDDQDQSKR